MNIFKTAKAYLRYTEAVRKAEEQHAKDGERYYVMPMIGRKKTLLILDRRNFRKLKRKGYITPQATIYTLDRECFYATSYRDNKGTYTKEIIKLKKQQYYDWYAKKV